MLASAGPLVFVRAAQLQHCVLPPTRHLNFSETCADHAAIGALIAHTCGLKTTDNSLHAPRTQSRRLLTEAICRVSLSLFLSRAQHPRTSAGLLSAASLNQRRSS